jgi:Mce-associated membrane protein
MAEAKKPPQDSATSKADAMALLEEAEAEAAEAEALATAARARARAARLRREALTQAETEAKATPESEAESEAESESESEAEAEAAEDHGDTATAPAAETVEVSDDTVAEADETVEASDEAADDEVSEAAETEEEAAEETVGAAAPESRSARWRRRLPSLSATWKVAAVLLICAFVGASGYMLWQDRETTQRAQRTANFVAGARQGIINMTSLDFNKAKEDVQRVLDSSTGQFRDEFQQRAKDFTTVVEQSKVVTQGTVTAAALESMDEHSASVLVSATSLITNSAGAKEEPRAWRFRVTVTEDGGQYKMSKVDFVP